MASCACQYSILRLSLCGRTINPSLITHCVRRLGAKHLAKPPSEDDEFTLNNKEIRVRWLSPSHCRCSGRLTRSSCQVGDEISLKEYFRNMNGVAGDDSELATTPAKAVPGYLTRPGMVASGSTTRQQTPRPGSAARPVPIPATTASDATPEPAGKRWNPPLGKAATPFRPPAPASSSAKRALQSGGLGPQPGSSRLCESGASDSRGSPVTADSARAMRERKLEELKAARDGKGKARAMPDASFDSDEELENSPPEHGEGGSAQKKRRIDSAGAAVTAALPAAGATSRLSAADLAFERSLGKHSIPARTTSLPSRLSSSSAKSPPLFRKDSSIPPSSVLKDEPLDYDEDDDEGLVSADDMEFEIDAAASGADGFGSSDFSAAGEQKKAMFPPGPGSSAMGSQQGGKGVRRYNVRRLPLSPSPCSHAASTDDALARSANGKSALAH